MRANEQALADAVRDYNRLNGHSQFNSGHLAILADWLVSINPKFDRVGWFLRVRGIKGGAK